MGYNAVLEEHTSPPPPSSGLKNKSRIACYLLHADFLLIFEPEDGGDMFFRNVVHVIVSKKAELFKTTAVITSDPAHWIFSILAV
jgi:ABC-type Na+ transport system ATPase subunit NatA